jgi:hypothetical protein
VILNMSLGGGVSVRAGERWGSVVETRELKSLSLP